MDNMTAQLANQLKQKPAMLKSLMRMLTQEDQGAGLQQAVQAASTGDTTQMIQMVKRVMESPDGAALAARINQAMQDR